MQRGLLLKTRHALQTRSSDLERSPLEGIDLSDCGASLIYGLRAYIGGNRAASLDSGRAVIWKPNYQLKRGDGMY